MKYETAKLHRMTDDTGEEWWQLEITSKELAPLHELFESVSKEMKQPSAQGDK